MASPAPSAGETDRLEISAAAGAPATERLRATTLPMQPAPGRPRAPRRFSWGAIAGTAAVVFVLALLFITAVELISGQPLSAIFGGADTGTTLHNLVNPPAASTTTLDLDLDHLDHVDHVLVDHHHDDVRYEHDEHHRAGGPIDDDDHLPCPRPPPRVGVGAHDDVVAPP